MENKSFELDFFSAHHASIKTQIALKNSSSKHTHNVLTLTLIPSRSHSLSLLVSFPFSLSL